MRLLLGAKARNDNSKFTVVLVALISVDNPSLNISEGERGNATAEVYEYVTWIIRTSRFNASFRPDPRKVAENRYVETSNAWESFTRDGHYHNGITEAVDDFKERVGV